MLNDEGGGWMRKIVKHNAGVTICMEEYCDEVPAYFDEANYHGLKILVALCKKHADEANKCVQ
jgi:hypothetical protein